MEETRERELIIDEARRVTRESRQENYGHPLINFGRIAEFWNTYLRSKLGTAYITPVDVAWMMTLLKIAREMQVEKRDNKVDAVGYIDCIDRMDAYMEGLGYQNGSSAFRDMPEISFIDLMDLLESADG